MSLVKIMLSMLEFRKLILKLFQSFFIVNLSNVTEQGKEVLDMLLGATLLQLEELSYHLQDYLISKYSDWVRQNYYQILTKTFEKRERYVKLWDYCMQGICEDPKALFSSEEFIKLDKDILFAILNQETLQCEELIIWEALIKWGIAQSPTISKKTSATSFDTTDWTDEEFITLKGIIEKFIPCIHFFEISSNDFYNKVRPFRQTLTPELFDEVLGYHMKEKKPKLWPRLGKVDSVIIKSKQATAISNLIKNYELSSQSGTKKCSLSLLYRADRDGFNSGIFRNQCNDQGASLALIKLSNGKIVGGYNPLGWMKVDPKDRTDYSKSFLFSFEPNLEVRSLKSVGVKNPSLAFDNQTQALHFGTTDLIINGQNGSCVARDFQSPIVNTRSFTVENIEVFAKSSGPSEDVPKPARFVTCVVSVYSTLPGQAVYTNDLISLRLLDYQRPKVLVFYGGAIDLIGKARRSDKGAIDHH
ncbi:2240_t:CDS:2 [Funneliformis mosseae]|uniref:2240_t:CDS:1 n=1 Tax=Funneliformis mosseae TaxID=27381 RepID=A0A9N9GVY2_FUNMO|nr:2240_t:CDS:2 [Funneliformis mosseae]